MNPDNRISLQIPAQDEADINNALNTLFQKLMPHLLTISDSERQALPKMKDKTLAFVTKATEHAEQNPALLPPYVDVVEWRRDFDAVTRLRMIGNQVSQLLRAVEDSAMVAGSEAYIAALSFYKNTQVAASLNVQGAKDITDDLKIRFSNQGRKRSAKTNKKQDEE